jgi:hypothetical protein
MNLFRHGNLLGILNSSKKLLQCAWNFLVIQSLINLDLIVALRRFGTINVHTIYNMQFFDNHRVSYWVTYFINKGEKKWKKKPMQLSTIFPSFISNGFSIKIFNNKVFNAYQHWKIVFSPKCLNENNNFQRNWWIIFYYIIFIFT